MQDREQAQKWVDFLNTIYKLDSDAMNTLFDLRVLTNDAVTAHPSVQVGSKTTLSFLGLLNGYLGANDYGYGPICSEWTSEGFLVGFRLGSESAGAKT